MLERCFRKPTSDLATCGLHDARLTEYVELIDADAPYLGYISCLKCPVSDTTVLDNRGFREHIPTE